MKKFKINVIIERSSDSFGGYADNVEGITAHADTVEDVKAQILEAIEIQKEINPKEVPADYTIEYIMDIPSLLNYYKGILTNSGLEKLTGINQKQIQHYATGFRNPRPEQRKKIEHAIHDFANQLLHIEL